MKFLLGLLFTGVVALSDTDPKSDPTAYYSEYYANSTVLYAYAVFCPVPELANWTCAWCKKVPRFQVADVIESEGLRSLTGYDPVLDQVVVAFRGTHGVGNWWYDMDITKVKYPGVDGGWVHKGFYSAWQNLKQQVMDSVNKLIWKYRSSTILITGHSLGAATGQIASLEIFSSANALGHFGRHLVEDFGSPKWANAPMVAYFKQLAHAHWRVVHAHDIVPTVPSGFNYVHTATEVWYTGDYPLVYHVCDGSGEDSQCTYFPPSIDDHSLYMGLRQHC